MLSLLLLASACLAQPADLQPRTSPATLTVGDLLTYTVGIPLSAGERLTGPGAEAEVAPWEVRGYHAEPSPGGVTATYSFAAFETGQLTVPAVEFSVVDAQGRVRKMKAAAVRVTVQSVLEDEKAEPADYVGPLVLREKPGALAVRAIVVLLVVALAIAVLVLLWRRHRRQRAAIEAQPDPPDVAALKALRALRAAQLPESGRLKQHYSQLADILRTYLSARYGVRTFEETTGRIVAQLRAHARAAEHAPVVEDLLRQADLAKFAKARPTAGAAYGDVDTAERLIRDTSLALGPAEET
jgi:hypothetical protein